jgi:clathrin heavy chain
MTLDLSVYLHPNMPNKVVACFAETGQFEKIVYSKKVDFQPDYATLLQHLVRTNPETDAQLVNDENGPLVDVESAVDIFMSRNMFQRRPSS